MKNKLNKIKKIILVLFLIGLAIIEFFTFLFANAKVNNSMAAPFNYHQKILRENSDSTLDESYWYARHDSNIAPTNIYMLDPIEITSSNVDPLANDLKIQIDHFKEALINLNLNNTFGEYVTNFQNNEYNIYRAADKLYSLEQRNNYLSQAISYFSSLEGITDNFKELNAFEATTKELSIFKPQKIINLNNAFYGALLEEYDKTNQYLSNVEYKVATIDLNRLTDDSFLNFNITNKATADSYLLSINNDKGSLFNAIKEASDLNVIENLLASGNIILRDTSTKTSKVYDQSKKEEENQEFIDFLTIDYEAPVKEGLQGKINIYIKPTSAQINQETAFTFVANDSMTTSLAAVGFLDTSIAPYYVQEEKINFKNEDQINNFYVHKTISNQVNNRFNFWIGADQTINLGLTVDGVRDGIFAYDVTSLELTFDGTSLNPATEIISVIRNGNTTEIINSSFDIVYEIYQIGSLKYAYVQFDGDDVVKIDDGENIDFANAAQYPLFWESPGNKINDIKPEAGSKKEIEITFELTNEVNETHYNAYFCYSYSNFIGDGFISPVQDKQWYVEDIDQGLNSYEFNYSYFYKNESNGIEGPKNKNIVLQEYDSDYQKKLLVHNFDNSNIENSSFDPIFKDDNYSVLDASGHNVMQLLMNNWEILSFWMKQKFDNTLEIKDASYYRPNRSNLTIEVPSILADAENIDELEQNASALVKLAYNNYDSLNETEKAYINTLDLSVRSKIEGKINKIIAEDGTLDWNAPAISDQEAIDEAIDANRLVLKILEKDVVKALESLLQNDIDFFLSKYATLLSDALAEYLAQNSSLIGISSQALKVIDPSKLTSEFQYSNIIALNGEPVINVSSGKEQFESLLTFIASFDLAERYLDNEASDYELLYETLKNSPNEDQYQKNLVKMATLIDKIIVKMLGESNALSLNDILNEIQKGKIATDQAANEIANTISSAINNIVKSDSEAFIYTVLNIQTSTSYIENLVIGHNLEIVINKWIELNEENLDNSVRVEMDNFSGYDPDWVVRIALSLEYYNIKYFLASLLEESKIPQTLDEILHSDFNDSVLFKIPESNSFINALADTHTLAKYGLFSTGLVTMVVGIIILLNALKQNLMKNLSNKAKISARVGAISIILMGLILIILGLILAPF